MKVLHVMAPSPVGGAEQVVLDLTEKLAETGLEVHLAAILDLEGPSGSAVHPFLARVGRGVTVHPLRVPHRGYLAERGRIRALVRTLRPDLVHTHGYRADVLAGSAARAEGCPVVATAHGFTGGGTRNRLYEWLQRRAFRRCDGVIPVSAQLERDLAASGVSRERLRTIPNARSRPDDVLPRAEARRRLGVLDEAFHIGWIGRMSREKGPDVMVEALRRLAERLPPGGAAPPRRVPVHATFIGDGPERAGLVDRTADSDPPAVRMHWPGALDGAARFLHGFDLVVLSSRTEGTPIVALEAMTLGVPLVATSVGGLPDLLGADRGWLVPPEDPGALAACMLHVLEAPAEARARSEAARNYVASHASPEGWARRHVEVYHHLVNARTPHPSAQVP